MHNRSQSTACIVSSFKEGMGKVRPVGQKRPGKDLFAKTDGPRTSKLPTPDLKHLKSGLTEGEDLTQPPTKETRNLIQH